MTSDPDKILVIKLSALGDFIQALGPMKAIRQAHPDAYITLMTTRPFASMGRDCGYFDDIWVDERPKFTDFRKWVALKKTFNAGRFDRVYDLQNNDRTALYFKLLIPWIRSGPEWVGAAKGASYRDDPKIRSKEHAFQSHIRMLGLAGIQNVGFDDLSWMGQDIDLPELQDHYAVLIPGSSPQHPEKRWPVMHFTAFAQKLYAEGIQPVLIGTRDESVITSEIALNCPGALDLTGQTSLYDIAALARRAKVVVGNDTGPIHIAALTGAPCVTLFCTRKSDPVKHAPVGPRVTKLKASNLEDIPVSDVWNAYITLKSD